MGRTRISLAVLAAGGLAALPCTFGCGEPVEARAAHAEKLVQSAVAPSIPFDSLFVLERRIDLEEPDSALITEIVSLDVDASGRLLIPEPTRGQVRVYSANGELIRNIGRRGDGPGEFVQPIGAAFGANGGLYVSEIGNPRVTRFDSTFDLDTIFPLTGAAFGSNIEAVGNRIAIFAMRATPGAELYALYSADGALQQRFHRFPDVIRETPYWIMVARSRIAVGDGSIFIADNLIYPIRRYSASGSYMGSLGTPPPSWQPAPRLQPGTFTGPTARAQFERWRRTFTTIAGLGVYRDSLLLVVHETLDADVLEYEAATYRADIYRLTETSAKIYADVRLPGPLLHAGRNVYLLLAKPGEGKHWTFGVYRLTGAGAE